MIRKASTQDLAWVAGLLRRSELPLQGLDTPGLLLFVKEDRGRVIGAVGLETYPPYALVRSLVVDGRERGKGHGRELLRHVIDHARANGLTTVYGLAGPVANVLTSQGFEEVPRDQIARPVHQSPELRAAHPSTARAFRLRLREAGLNPAIGARSPANPTTRF